MHANSISDPVVRERVKQVLKKINMTFDAYIDEKSEEDYAILFKKRR